MPARTRPHSLSLTHEEGLNALRERYAAEMARFQLGQAVMTPNGQKVVAGDVGMSVHAGIFERAFSSTNPTDGDPRPENVPTLDASILRFSMEEHPSCPPSTYLSIHVTEREISAEVGLQALSLGAKYKCTRDFGAILKLNYSGFRWGFTLGEEVKKVLCRYLRDHYHALLNSCRVALPHRADIDEVALALGAVNALEWETGVWYDLETLASMTGSLRFPHPFPDLAAMLGGSATTQNSHSVFRSWAGPPARVQSQDAAGEPTPVIPRPGTSALDGNADAYNQTIFFEAFYIAPRPLGILGQRIKAEGRHPPDDARRDDPASFACKVGASRSIKIREDTAMGQRKAIRQYIFTKCDDALFALVTEDDLWHIALATKAQTSTKAIVNVSSILISKHVSVVVERDVGRLIWSPDPPSV